MPMLLGFKPQFQQPIITGTKIHTLRDKRKVTPKIGETLHMYTGLRTRKAKLIRKDLKLKAVQEVYILLTWDLYLKRHYVSELLIDGRDCTNALVEFFINDGFSTAYEYIAFVNPPKGKNCYIKKDIFHWTDFKY